MHLHHTKEAAAMTELITRVLRAQYHTYRPMTTAKDIHKAAAIGDTIRMFMAELRALDQRFDAEQFVAACIGQDDQDQPSGVVTDTGREHGPAHPIDVMERMANRTPWADEGSLGDLRQTEAWHLRDDYRRAHAGDQSLVDEYELDWLDDPARALDWIKGVCVRDAIRAITRWTTDPQSA